MPLITLSLLLVGYLLGSIPSGYLAGRWLAGLDIRQEGSGSTGATNVLRVVGKGPALAVFLVDVLKGAAAVLLAKAVLDPLGCGVVLAGLAALAGHIWPVWLGWKGGKAVATGLGMLLGLTWPVGLACFGIFLTVLSLSRIVSLASVVAALALPLLMLGWFADQNLTPGWPYLSLALLTTVLVVWRHRTNIARLLAGTEPKLGAPKP
jgi:glycerol-3-phosphate acyltransferase PlsY